MVDDRGYGDKVYESGEAVEDAEDLDPLENLTGKDPDEVMQTGYSPPDREPRELRERPTPAEEHEGASLERRLAGERPDVGAEGQPEPGASDPRAGRLVGQDEGAHTPDEATAVAEDVGPAGYASSAEEAAVRVRD